jgi:hypothetical protein
MGSGGASGFAVAGAGGYGEASGTIVVYLTSEAAVDEGVLFRTQQRAALKYQKRNNRQAFAF